MNPAKALKGPKTAARAPEYYTETEAMTLLDYAASHAERDPRRAVGYVAMVTFFCTGVRLKELAGLRLAQVHLSERRINIMGKGSKCREVPIDVTGAAVLGWYLDEVRPHLPGPRSSLTVALSTAADIPTDFTALINEHGPALVEGLTAVSDAAASEG